MLSSGGPWVALDLGSSRIRVAVPEREAMVDRPSAIPAQSLAPRSAGAGGHPSRHPDQHATPCDQHAPQQNPHDEQPSPHDPHHEPHDEQPSPHDAHHEPHGKHRDQYDAHHEPHDIRRDQYDVPREPHDEYRGPHGGWWGPHGEDREPHGGRWGPRVVRGAQAFPVRYGMVADVDACARLVRGALLEAHPGSPPREVVLAVPVAASGHDRRRAVAAVRAAAGCAVRTVEAPLAAAIGAGLPANGPHPYLLMDIGAGIMEAAVIIDGAVVHARSIQYATCAPEPDPASASAPTPKATPASKPHSRAKPGDEASARAEGGARTGGGAEGGGRPGAGVGAAGGDGFGGGGIACSFGRAYVGPPRYVTVRLAAELLGMLDDMPARLRVAARAHGLMLTGGGALLPYLPGALTAGTGLTVTVAHDPARATIRGLARL